MATKAEKDYLRHLLLESLKGHLTKQQVTDALRYVRERDEWIADRKHVPGE